MDQTLFASGHTRNRAAEKQTARLSVRAAIVVIGGLSVGLWTAFAVIMARIF
jgi:hypothetical protein